MYIWCHTRLCDTIVTAINTSPKMKQVVPMRPYQMMEEEVRNSRCDGGGRKQEVVSCRAHHFQAEARRSNVMNCY